MTLAEQQQEYSCVSISLCKQTNVTLCTTSIYTIRQEAVTTPMGHKQAIALISSNKLEKELTGQAIASFVVSTFPPQSANWSSWEQAPPVVCNDIHNQRNTSHIQRLNT